MTIGAKGRGRFSAKVAGAALLLLAAAQSGVLADESGYQVRPETKLKVTVVEWVASTGDYKEWTALNGEFTVTPAGNIFIPMIGQMNVEDKTVDEISQLIGANLKRITGLATAPTASVEVVKYPMVYVSGAVERSGEFEFRPGLTVKQAMAMAGGKERRSSPQGEYSDAEQIRYAGDLGRLELQLKQYMAKRARLMAEFSGKDAIEFPPEIAAGSQDPIIGQIIQSETALFKARADALSRALQSATELETLLTSEISVLDEKMSTQDRQVTIAQDELSDISKLVDTKILTTSRKTALERTVAEMQGSKLDLVVASMQAKQKLSETKRDAETLKSQRTTEAGQELQTTESDIEDTKLKRATTLQLLQIAGATVSRYQSLKAVDLQPLEFWVTRTASDIPTTSEVQDTEELQPGDVLDVRYNVSTSFQGTVISALEPEQKQTP